MAEVSLDVGRLGVAFARVLRGAGLDVPVGCVLTFSDALREVGVDARTPVYWAGRSTLVRRPEDIPLYDAAFAAFWQQFRDDTQRQQRPPDRITLLMDSDDGDEGDADSAPEQSDEPSIQLRFSRAEVLRHKDFSAFTAAELDEARRLMTDLRLVGAMKRSRRMVPSKRPSGRPDLRRTVQAALRSGGEPLRRKHLVPGERPRRLVLLLDVSGSMEPYARALVRFVHAAVVGRQKVEAFALGTRLTRITRELSSRDPDKALARAGAAVADWSGGTRLGDGLRAFCDEWGQRGMARGATIVILSDGWDRGEPEVMAEAMQRLHRLAHQLVWMNPLKATPGYAPLARGMAAALPHVDAFIEGHNLAAIEELAEVISR